MDFVNLEMYQRLRDFDVPAAVLDEIFENEGDLKILRDSWQEMVANGLQGDEIAWAVAALIFEEMDTSLDLD